MKYLMAAYIWRGDDDLRSNNRRIDLRRPSQVDVLRWLTFIKNIKMYENGIRCIVEELLLPYTHIHQVSSKEMRKRIAEAFNYWLQVPEEKMREVVKIMEMYHVASLLSDDIQDGDTVRRGVPSAHCVYGVPWTINTTVHVIILVLQKCHEFHPMGAGVFYEQSLELIRGQGKEIYWRDSFICPSEEEYKDMVKQKTGGMFNFAARLMQLVSDNTTDYREFGKMVGMYFQMRDDFCNILQPENLEERPSDKNLNDYYMDLTEGKYTLPIIHAARSSRGAAILNILKQRTKDICLKQHCVSMMEELGSLEYTRGALRDLDRDIRVEIARLGGNPAMVSVMDQLHTWEISRS